MTLKKIEQNSTTIRSFKEYEQQYSPKKADCQHINKVLLVEDKYGFKYRRYYCYDCHKLVDIKITEE